MTTVFIIHGAFGHPEENWFPWIKDRLRERGYKVIAPRFPTPEGQSLASWRRILGKYSREIDEETIFIAHSLGPLLVLDLLEHKEAKGCIFVAGFFNALGKEELDKINSTFYKRHFDWEKIRFHCSRFYIFNSSNDPYVPAEEGERLSVLLKGELITIPSAGHYNLASGYKRFPDLLKIIEEIENQ